MVTKFSRFIKVGKELNLIALTFLLFAFTYCSEEEPVNQQPTCIITSPQNGVEILLGDEDGNRKLYKTSDGGVNWVGVSTINNLGDVWIDNAKLFSERVGLAQVSVDNQHYLVKTTDLWETIELYMLPTSYEPYWTYLINSNEALVVLRNHGLYRYKFQTKDFRYLGRTPPGKKIIH